MCPCDKGSQQQSGHSECCQQVQGGDPSPLLALGGHSWSALSSVRETGAHWNESGTEPPGLRDESIFQLGELGLFSLEKADVMGSFGKR